MKQVTQPILHKLQFLGILIVLAGLLSINPVKAFDESISDLSGDKSAAAAPSAAIIVVNGGGQLAISNAIQKAQPGDTILVKAGNYDDNKPLSSLKLSKSGTSSSPITLLGENRPKLGNLIIENSAYFTIEGFEIANQTSTSFFIGLSVRNSKYVTIRNMLIHHLTASAISVDKDSSNITIEMSKIYEIIPNKSGSDAHCFVTSAGKNITFRNNECYGFIGDGYQAWRVDDTILYNRGTTLIEGNRIYNTKGACSENAIDIKGEAGSLIIRDNILHGFRRMDTAQCTIHASGCGDCQAVNIQDGGTGNLLIENNEIFDSYAGIYNSAMKGTIQNNIFHNITKYVVLDKGPASKYYHNTFVNNKVALYKGSITPKEVINNLFYNAGDTVSGNYHHNGWFGSNQLRSGSGDVKGSNPQINSGYALMASSPLIDRGTNLGLSTDFTTMTNSRPSGSAPDIGAFEFPSAPSILTPSEPSEPPLTSTVLTLNGPTAVAPGETISLSLQAQDLTGNGLYGAQLDINYDPTLVSISNLQINPDLPFVLFNSADNSAGKIRLVASRQGSVPGLTGDVSLLTFDVTPVGATGTANFTFENVKLGDPQAAALNVIAQDYALSISEPELPEPTDEPAPEPTDEPAPEPTDQPIPEPTDQPIPEPTDQPLPEPTDQPIPEPTDQPIPEPTDQPVPEPTDPPIPEPTDQPIPEPTDQPIPEPTDQPIPQPTDEPATATLLGQVILAGRADSNWSGANLTVDDTGQNIATDASGHFNLVNVAIGAHTSITADASGYLPAVCTAPTFVAAEMNLSSVTLLSGDINDDNTVDVTDATTVGVSFGNTGPNLPADINQDSVVDIFDIILVSVNFGQGPQVWNCLAQ